MALDSLINAFRSGRGPSEAYQTNNGKLVRRFLDVLHRTWDLGFTSFGGPPVHFGIFYRRFVEGSDSKPPWVDEQTYQELFAVCQALPGPASTKMLFCMSLVHAGFLPAVLVFILWSLPGAIGMFALSLGVGRLNEVLPDIVYALLSGLNASTVGIIALAGVQLAEKAIKDKATRILVIFGACAGMCYQALWYFPLLIVIGGAATATWDLLAGPKIVKLKSRLQRRKSNPQREAEETLSHSSTQPDQTQQGAILQRRNVAARTESEPSPERARDSASLSNNSEHNGVDTSSHSLHLKWGVLIIVGFFATFIAILVARGKLEQPPLELDLFSNMYLAGTVIFGGGPVVIPLLREYVVAPGWVSSRDFLIGLALIQAFPGPNFNFAIFLGGLAVASTPTPSVLGAFMSFIGIFLPGMTLAIGFQSCWSVMRKYPLTSSALRGMNAAAVGLVFTAVYRLWEIGYLSADASSGQSLGKEPFWLVVAALTYAENAWFNVPPAIAIAIGGILGLCWYGVVHA
ncbi:hypothetical protein FQN57_006870 [Myotisia sp. PD_48]|nr:hypothetical protein FQN57_006870 [Myotisia sp. PD_48]